MFIDSEKRLKQLSDEAKKNTEDLEEAKKNSRFTQVSPKGWERVRELLKDSQGISALKLYSFLAEHIDPTCGAVVADQQFLAEKLGVSRSTIIRWLNYLESKNALVRIPVAGMKSGRDTTLRKTMQRLSLKHWSTKTVIFSAESWPCFQIELAAGGQSGATC